MPASIARPADRRIAVLALTLLAGMLAWDQARLLTHFAFRYVDKDQAVMWTGAFELAHGRFHEPRFFGQDYSAMADSVVAAPPTALGAPPNVALPLATCLLFLGPFVGLAIIAARRDLWIAAAVLLAIPLLLPLRGSMIAGMPRGYVGGIALAGAAACVALASAPRWTTLLVTLLLTLSVSVNPNAAMIALPIGVALVLRQGRSRSFYAWAVPGVLIGALLHFLSVDFYRRHPANLVYGSGPAASDFKLEVFMRGVQRLDRYVGDFVPFGPGHSWILVGVLVLVGIGLLRTRARLVAWVAALALATFGLGLDRVHAGCPSIYWPWSRAYLAIPLLLGLGATWVEDAASTRVSPRLRRVAILVVLALATASAMTRSASLDRTIAEQVRVPNPVDLGGRPVEAVRTACLELDAVATREHAELVVFNHDDELLAYACEPVLDGRVRTLLVRDVVPERRTWRIAEEARAKRPRVLLYGFTVEQVARGTELGLVPYPPVTAAGGTVLPADLPPDADLFALLVAMRASGADDLADRARQLTR